MVIMVPTRVAWRFTITTDGVRCATAVGNKRMLPLFVDNWDSSEVHIWKSLLEPLVIFGLATSNAGENIGVCKNDYNNFKGRMLACYD